MIRFTVLRLAAKNQILFPRAGACFLALLLALAPAGCGKKPEADKNKAPAAAAKPEMTFESLLERAGTDESYFTGVSRLLVSRSVLLPLDQVPEPSTDGSQQPRKISIKVLKEKEKEGPGTALVFSGKQSLGQAGDKLGWPKNDKGMYSFAAMNGQAAFRVLQANGYHRVILDVAGAFPLVLEDAAIKDLAEGKIPAFPAKN